jgi:hypothetical protein
VSYSTVANVRSIVVTDITDPEIADIITWVDEIIKIKINVALFTPLFLTGISALYAAYRCLLRDPNAQSLGEYSERRDLTLMKQEIDEILGNAAAGIVPLGMGVKLVAAMEPL